MKRGIKYDFPLIALLLIPVGVSLNVVGYQLSSILKLPVFIDMIGTIMVSMIAGPWIGALTGLLGNVVSGMLNPIAIAYGVVSMGVGFISGYLSKGKFYTNLVGVVIGCAILSVVSAAMAAVVTVFMFGGVTGAGTDLITATFLAAGKELWNSVMSTNLISGTINTIINFAISWVIVRRIPDRFLVKLNYGAPYVKKGVLTHGN
ncbi:ECF transporter S component [Vagococcus sp. BWB3-3]|uniref:ECF transporter S component n=1 Tax=Vagococcus allomyrinae TaxID=2794353 RepID=A0A940PIY3_9ENTE|nr:ECF transporter S component [Vagococcus allomyrinae]MBP1044436.1 ECF transporter S component [Vagococcus allomyrinae]